ncbi:MAG: putative sulfur carrier protein [Methanonatronarchaeales archaeon]|nr:putative sulfur carrier protein [Methanonatronarchaeales archaeon]
MADMEPDETVDSRDSACPGPLMDLVGRIKKSDPGTVLELLTSDEGSKKDVPDWLENTRHDLLEIEDQNGHWAIYVKVN